MAENSMGTLLKYIRGLAAGRLRQESDGALLRAFAARGDEDAFAALVRRHGPLVLSVCRRVLVNEQDAEDAFQATFLLLVQNVASIRKAQSLSSWLHGVAYRMAKNAARAAARRRRYEREVTPMRETGPGAEAALREALTYLDEAVQALPETYRAPFILCCLENRSSAEVARALGLKEATVRTRLARDLPPKAGRSSAGLEHGREQRGLSAGGSEAGVEELGRRAYVIPVDGLPHDLDHVSYCRSDTTPQHGRRCLGGS